MRERITARVLLLDPDDRVLLMRGRLPSDPDAPGAWFTVGGGAEPGETVLEAAVREIHEETGFRDVELGPVVWYREAVHRDERQELMVLKESYIVARCAGGEPSRDGWQPLEASLVDDIRWWTLAEIAQAVEDVYPEGFADLLPDILEGRYPDTPRVITVPRSTP